MHAIFNALFGYVYCDMLFILHLMWFFDDLFMRPSNYDYCIIRNVVYFFFPKIAFIVFFSTDATGRTVVVCCVSFVL